MENMNFNSLEEILEFAIQEESDAGVFYAEQAKKTTKLELKNIWQQLSHDELRHKAVLANLLEQVQKKGEHILNFKTTDVTDYVPELIPKRDYNDMEKAIITAIQNENDAFFMYRFLASKVNEPRYKGILQTLATEELKHKESLLIELTA